MNIKTVYIWSNGMTSVFDYEGQQVPDLQGRFGEKAEQISLNSDESTEFIFAAWRSSTIIRLNGKVAFDRLW